VSAIENDAARLLDKVTVGTLATAASNGHPRQSLVYFAREGDRLVITTEAGRLKARDVRRDGWASLSVRADTPPYPSATFSGPAEILTAGIGGPTAAVMQRIAGTPEPPPEQSDEALEAVGRVILAIDVERVSAANYLDQL
jgi:PPOX class probable F420-dependent enzyme